MLGWLYAQIADLRNTLYDKGAFQSFPLGLPTIGIGNITAGGTGKTPLVAYVAELLAEKGEKVCIISRGYGRKDSKNRVLVSDGKSILADPQSAGDEPYELAEKLLNKAIVISDADRISAAKWAKESFDVSVFVLDDAFQHRRARRDLDIVCIDATRPFRYLREPPKNLKRAGAVVITRADQTKNLAELKAVIARSSAAPIFEIKNLAARLLDLSSGGEPVHPDELTGKKALAFCGLGNPENFFRQLRGEGFDLVGSTAFRDHYPYRQADIDRLEEDAKEKGAEVLLTTGKDRVKLKNLRFSIRCLAVESEMVFDDEKGFRKTISGALQNEKSL